ncbi:putative nuclease HARBI1 [Chenopodium quinoa]|uniref:putative nuclease HARBI1 n=1 Tax=Chenopodium quinoa TaxID=63459 RepID=UPI000B7859C2|nr:putative nuclease HARBI1 [Chenopodium quinoa]
MSFISSTSSSSSDDFSKNHEFDCLVDEYVANHLPHRLLPPDQPQEPPLNNETELSTEPKRDREREKGHVQLYNDYFANNPVYNDNQFRRRFRMQRSLFCRIMSKVVEGDQFFQQRRNADGKLGLSPLQKCTAAIRMLAYGVAADAVDEYLRLGQTTSRQALQHFCQGVISQFESEYLRKPTDEDLRRILHQNDLRGFPGMIGSIDCMHWEWKNCPTAWKAQYAGRSKSATLILEAVADQDLWIWHAFFGMPGSCNDLNVLYRSPVFDDVLQGHAPPINFTVNGHQYELGYYLADGIYPRWPTFIQGITHPHVRKDKLFSDQQAAVRKDVERAFGVLQARFAILRQPALAYDEDILCDIMKACIIMHNMIVEDERHNYARADVLRRYYEEDRPQRTVRRADPSTSATVFNNEPFEFNVGRPPNIDFNTYLERRISLRDREIHSSLKQDLVEHIWQNFRHNAVE